VKMSPKERFEAAMRLADVDRVPAASPVQTGTIPLMQASGASWPDAHREPEKMAKLALAAYEIAGIESVRVPFCGTVEVEAIGCELDGWQSDRQPSTRTYLLKSEEMIDKAQVPDPHTSARMPVVIKSVKILNDKVGKTLPVMAAIVSPFEFAVRSRGMDSVMRDIFTKPNLLRKVLDFAVKVETEYGKALYEAGANALFLIDGSSQFEVLGPKLYEDFSKPYTKTLIGNLGGLTISAHMREFNTDTRQDGRYRCNCAKRRSFCKDRRSEEQVKKRAAIVGNVDPPEVSLWALRKRLKTKLRTVLNRELMFWRPAAGSHLKLR